MHHTEAHIGLRGGGKVGIFKVHAATLFLDDEPLAPRVAGEGQPEVVGGCLQLLEAADALADCGRRERGGGAHKGEHLVLAVDELLRGLALQCELHGVARTAHHRL